MCGLCLTVTGIRRLKLLWQMLPASNCGPLRPPIVSPVTTASSLPLTGERTVPGITEENYWFRRHEAAYHWVADTFGAQLGSGAVVDAGCGEGYGIDLLSTGRTSAALGLELDAASARHAATYYRGHLNVAQANLDKLPLRSQSIALLVSMQVIEHLWNLPAFLSECRRVVSDDGVCIFTTPNRLTFSPGLGRGDKPVNPFHVAEFDATQLRELVSAAGFGSVRCLGLSHSSRLASWEASNGSIIEAQVQAVVNEAPWSNELACAVAAVKVDDFEIGANDVDSASDLIVVARPGLPL